MELQKSETKEELLLNTINYFNTSNRGVDGGGGCVYHNADTGNRCAIGRELSKELAYGLEGSVGFIYDLLPKRLKDMDADFLTQVQRLHDREEHWDCSGLSKLGHSKARSIIKKYNLDLQI
jgi:hypothetical protein